MLPDIGELRRLSFVLSKWLVSVFCVIGLYLGIPAIITALFLLILGALAGFYEWRNPPLRLDLVSMWAFVASAIVIFLCDRRRWHVRNKLMRWVRL